MVDGLTNARRSLRHSPIAATFGWFPYALGLLASAYVAARLTDWLDVSRAGTWRVVAVLLVHQLVVTVSVVCRAAWFARALRLVANDGRTAP